MQKDDNEKSEGTRQDATKQSETQLEVLPPWSNKKRCRNSSVGTSKAWQEEQNLDTEDKKDAIGETKEKAECPEMDADKPEEETLETLNPQNKIKSIEDWAMPVPTEQTAWNLVNQVPSLQTTQYGQIIKAEVRKKGPAVFILAPETWNVGTVLNITKMKEKGSEMTRIYYDTPTDVAMKDVTAVQNGTQKK